MNNSNLYWGVYKNLESELIRLSEIVHIDDKQLDVYSVHIAGLLIRTCVEIEAIAKELYFSTGGEKAATDKDLYFDTDCLGRLEDLWTMSKKVVLVSHPNFMLSDESNILTPLHKAHKRGSSSADWSRNYQAVKHNRKKCLKNGNIKSFIKALAALYLLNAYYRNYSQSIGEDKNGATFDNRLGSNVFSVLVHPHKGSGYNLISNQHHFNKLPDFEKYVYLIKPTDETQSESDKLFSNIANELSRDRITEYVTNELSKRNISPNKAPIGLIENLITDFQNAVMDREIKQQIPKYQRILNGLRYEAILNKNQDYFT